ncbi:MAG: hypothetical protein MEQ07_10140 [Aquimonas sp.]|nr:hypothetical protein [Aquimonas sp.]
MRDTPLPALGSPLEFGALQGQQVQLPALLAQAELEPALALAILCAGHRSERAIAPRGLKHCINLLGLDQLQALARPLAQHRLDPRQPGMRMALQAMADSRLAGLFVLRWLRAALASDEDARQWFTVAAGVARWKLPLIEPERAADVEARVEAGERRAPVELTVWGCDLSQLSTLHLQDLGWRHAPALGVDAALAPMLLATAARQGRLPPEQRELSEADAAALRAPMPLCSLAGLLAHEARHDWFSSRFNGMVSAAACWLGREREEVLQGLQRQAVYASGELRFRRGLLAPANGLLKPPRAPRARPAPAPAPAAALSESPARAAGPSTPTATSPAPASASEHASRPSQPAANAPAQAPLHTYLQDCRERRLTDLRALFAAHVGALAEIGLSRCALFLSAEGGQLGCYFAHGHHDPAAVRRLRFALAPEDLLAKLLRGQLEAFWIQPAQVESVRAKLPEALREWPPSGGFALAAARHGARTLGLWWADAGATSEIGLDPARFSAFRQLGAAFGPEFTRLVQAQRERAATR